MPTKIKKKEKQDIQIKLPKTYFVLLLNNPVTHFDAVVEVLSACFDKNFQESQQIMMEAHQNGKSVCFSGTFDEALGKISQARQYCMEKNCSPDGQMKRYSELNFIMEEK